MARDGDHLCPDCRGGAGVPFADVEVVHGDTSITPRGSGTRASRSLVVGGTAIVKACERVTAKAVQIAGALLHVDPQSVTLEEGKFCVKDLPTATSPGPR